MGLLAAVTAMAMLRPALAAPLDRPREQGLVGERFDGFAVVRDPNASASVRNLVKDINAKRRAYYESVAKQQNATLTAVGKIYANEIFDNAPPGYWFLTDTGKWLQK